jgi:bacterioferritin-associated ferredoxin
VNHEVHGMYVCCCNAVTDREVAEAIQGGARTRAEVTRFCGAGGDCGACHETIEEMIEGVGGGCRASLSKLETAKPERAEPLVPAAALVRERAA